MAPFRLLEDGEYRLTEDGLAYRVQETDDPLDDHVCFGVEAVRDSFMLSIVRDDFDLELRRC